MDFQTAPTAAKTSKWFYDGPPVIKHDAREVLEKYSKIPSSEVEVHVAAIREKAWAIHPYPCIGGWRFLEFSNGENTAYPEILERMRTGEQVYLDLGCAFAQDVRRLVADGVDSRQIYGSDLRLEFIDLGYDLFRDRETLKTRFIDADVFNAESDLKDLIGKVDIIGASSFFHLFSWDEQIKIARQVMILMKPKSGSLLVGRQIGHREAREEPRNDGAGSRFRHSLESWRRFWKEAGDKAGVEMQVEGKETAITEKMPMPLPEGFIALEFAVRRM